MIGESPPARRPLRVAVVGPGECDAATELAAEEVGRLLAQAGAVVLTGGLDGVMAAAARGAASGGGISVGLLPDVTDGRASPALGVALPTGLGEARDAVLVTAADAVLAVGGSWGTLAEVALARRLGRLVVALVPSAGVGAAAGCVADSPADAVRAVVTAAGRRSG